MWDDGISSEGQDFIVALRLLDEDEDVVILQPEFLITGAPEDLDAKEMRDVLEKTGEYEASSWREYRVVPQKEWNDVEKWINHETPYAWASELFGPGYNPPFEQWTTYSELVQRISDEKRVTLRLPIGLHVSLSRAAKDMTLNAFCIKTLADAVGYTDLPEFEAQRRKPGRPKKVQDSE
jgi:hypothetical protein